MHSRHAMLNHELARPIGIVPAMNVGGARKQPRGGRALTDCLVTRADGSQYVIARRSTNGAARRTTRATVTAALAPRLTAASLPNANGGIAYD